VGGSGDGSWLMGMSAQNRPMTGGPFRRSESAGAVVVGIRAVGAEVEVFGRPGRHLFTDPSLPGQYDGQAATVLWERARTVCRSPRG
jgi:hypothetical protein